ncbi:1818_t:CDS:2 [Funneliformis caledonium]|uniref:1818_t:CDS:1 n=1 Tax=Funneliformis caledonium TaxID=1117310 RepID=A0A9N9BNP4_9GLOM|nr:1818_t:CDS:2 [Funneliformis caledonium]
MDKLELISFRIVVPVHAPQSKFAIKDSCFWEISYCTYRRIIRRWILDRTCDSTSWK